jgi:hypothetical protein
MGVKHHGCIVYRQLEEPSLTNEAAQHVKAREMAASR